MSAHNALAELERCRATSVQEVTATSDGLTTGLIRDDVNIANVTCGTANYIATLPKAVTGKVLICTTAGAEATEFRTPATSGQTINGVDSDGTNELAVATASVVFFTAISDSAWLAYGWLKDGTITAQMVPD